MANDPAALATQEEALPMRELALLGTLTGPAGPEALLRLPGGGITRARPGDKLEGVQITAITNGELLLLARGRSFRMTLPGS
ncbi:hypothetical protein [Oceanicola sp. S124]|uniref:hypothetical protein n=1 Tax=Oceanicola sp. S124 TaxID=1042378 RepID=UPI0002558D06|nr:hypothetical protein [Oceanicola sp. S124]